jgi:ABC-2 type transport system permease protein
MTVAEETLTDVPQPIQGPSALGGGRRRFWNLLWLTSLSDYKSRYADSTFSYLWTIARPLMLFGILYLVFTQVIRFGGRISNYPVLLLMNIMLFQFFAEATNRSVRSMMARGLVRKMDIPRLVLPLSAVLTAGLVSLSALLVVFVWILAYGIQPMWTWLLFPVIAAALVALTVAIAALVSALYVTHRDVAQVWPVLVRLLFYGSTVIFPIGSLPPAGFLHDVEVVNPLSPILAQARVWIIDSNAPGWIEASGSTLAALAPLLAFLGICFAAVVASRRAARVVAEEL